MKIVQKLLIFGSLLFLASSCSDVVRYEHDFAEHSDFDHDFRSAKERKTMVNNLARWVEAYEFAAVTKESPNQISAFRFEPDAKIPRFFARLTYELKDNPDGSQFWLHIYLKTNRWSDAKAHRKQKKFTDSLHEEFRQRFARPKQLQRGSRSSSVCLSLPTSQILHASPSP